MFQVYKIIGLYIIYFDNTCYKCFKFIKSLCCTLYTLETPHKNVSCIYKSQLQTIYSQETPSIMFQVYKIIVMDIIYLGSTCCKWYKVHTSENQHKFFIIETLFSNQKKKKQICFQFRTTLCARSIFFTFNLRMMNL